MSSPPGIPINQRSGVLWGLLVLVVVLWNGREVIGFDFVAWDDELNITVNPQLGPPNAENVAWMFSDWTYMRRYVPFGWLGFSVAYTFSGLSPTAYHVGNVLLHVANAVILYVFIAWALGRWVIDSRANWIPPSAAAGALVWAVHPFRAETVGWASGLLYSLACFFALLSVLAYCGAHTAGNASRSRAWRLCAVVLYTISLLTYPITIGLIVAFIAIDAAEWRRERARRDAARNVRINRLILQKIPFIIAAAAVTGITVVARVAAGSFWGRAPTLDELGIVDRVMRALYTAAYYLWKTCWPTNLTPLPTNLGSFSPFGWAAILSALAICGITWLLWRQRERRFGALLLWTCYLALLIPMLGLTEKVYHSSDRYTYLPAMLGGLALAAILVSASRRVIWAAGSAVVVAVFAMARMNSAQLQIWRDTPTLFARCIESSTVPRLTADVYQRWANFHSFRGNTPAATAVLARAERDGLQGVVRDEIVANLAQAIAEIRQGDAPLVARIHGTLALEMARRRRHVEADEHFTAALKLAPYFASLRYNQALHAAGSGDPRRALGLLLTVTAQVNGTISATAQRQAWALIAQAFTRANEPELARFAEKRASLLADS